MRGASWLGGEICGSSVEADSGLKREKGESRRRKKESRKARERERERKGRGRKEKRWIRSGRKGNGNEKSWEVGNGGK